MTSSRSEHAVIPIIAGTLRVVVVADTHSHPHARAAELIAREKPDRIFHAGDIGDLSVLDELASIAPISAVRGNIDERVRDVPEHLAIDLVEGGEKLLTILLTHIAVNGPRLRADAFRRAKTENADLVICGHSHVPFLGRDRDVSVFNPGSIGPRRFQLPIVFGVLELADRNVTMKHVDCETGATWLPKSLQH